MELYKFSDKVYIINSQFLKISTNFYFIPQLIRINLRKLILFMLFLYSSSIQIQSSLHFCLNVSYTACNMYANKYFSTQSLAENMQVI